MEVVALCSSCTHSCIIHGGCLQLYYSCGGCTLSCTSKYLPHSSAWCLVHHSFCTLWLRFCRRMYALSHSPTLVPFTCFLHLCPLSFSSVPLFSLASSSKLSLFYLRPLFFSGIFLTSLLILCPSVSLSLSSPQAFSSYLISSSVSLLQFLPPFLLSSSAYLTVPLSSFLASSSLLTFLLLNLSVVSPPTPSLSPSPFPSLLWQTPLFSSFSSVFIFLSFFPWDMLFCFSVAPFSPNSKAQEEPWE